MRSLEENTKYLGLKIQSKVYIYIIYINVRRMTSPMMMSGAFIPLHVDAKHLTCNFFTHPQHMGSSPNYLGLTLII